MRECDDKDSDDDKGVWRRRIAETMRECRSAMTKDGGDDNGPKRCETRRLGH